MAKTITRDVLRDRVRQRGEWPSTDWLPDAELNSYINDSLAALWDLLVLNEPERYVSTADISILAGQAGYDIVDDAADFYRLVEVLVADSSSPSGFRRLRRATRKAFHDYPDGVDKRDTRYYVRNSSLLLAPPPTWTGTIRLEYIPAAPTLGDDVTTFDSVNVWTEWLVLDVCVKVATKEESDPTVFMAERQRCEQRIIANSEVNHADSPTVFDVQGKWGPRLADDESRFG